jgi:hypothetical protein
MELQSAIAFIMMNGRPESPDLGHRASARTYFARALMVGMKPWGFDGDALLDDLMEKEIGDIRLSEICERHFTWTEEAETLFRQAKDLESEEAFGRYVQTLRTAVHQCINWKPGDPCEWRREEMGRIYRDLNGLSARFAVRYPKIAKSVQKRYARRSLFPGL